MRDPDAIVIGSGPNGLVAAVLLAQQGFRVLVVEANPHRPGGALGSEELTRPGFVHDVGAGFFPFGTLSPAFRALDLGSAGVEFLNARFESCHPALDGSVASIARDPELARTHFGSPEDGARWLGLAGWYQRVERELLATLLLTFPPLGPAWRFGFGNLLRLSWYFAHSGAGLSRSLFRSEAARRVLPSLALHVDVGPEDHFGAGLGVMLGLTASTGGYAVARGGAQTIANALVTLLERQGGRLRLGARACSIVVRAGRAHAVLLDNGEELSARRAILADTSAPLLYLELLRGQPLPFWVRRKMQHFPRGFATFKVDFALSRPVPWRHEAAREAAVVHAAESLDDLTSFAREVRRGRWPERPYLVVGQHSLVDPSRAPKGAHTLYVYSRVPAHAPGGWDEARESFADRVEARIEELAPGFRQGILARHVTTPPDFEADNQNLAGGDLGGGSNAWTQQLLFRPVFPYFRYRTPVRGLYLCSSYAHPGAGVHGMCGYNAALTVARDTT